MEVHHHPYVANLSAGQAGKNFKEYFLEFIMIFLAVMPGFFAEQIRESFAEKTNAKEYLETDRDELLQQQSQFMLIKKFVRPK